jgi:hypothetical protein
MESTASALAPASNVSATTRWVVGMRPMSWPSSDRGNGGAGVVGGFDVLDGAGRVDDATGGPDRGALVAVGDGVVGDAIGGDATGPRQEVKARARTAMAAGRMRTMAGHLRSHGSPYDRARSGAMVPKAGAGRPPARRFRKSLVDDRAAHWLRRP